MKIALLVFNWRGHFTHFAHLLYLALKTRGNVTLIGPRAAFESEEFQNSFKPELPELHFIIFEGGEKNAVAHYACRRDFDLLFSNGLDTYWHRLLPKLLWWKICGRLKTCISGILLNCAFAYPENSAFSYKLVRKFLLRNIAPIVYGKIFIIDEIAYGLLRLNGRSAFQLLTDPVENPPSESRRELRGALMWNENDRILLAIGAIIPEKRLDLLIRAFVDTKPRKNQKLLIAGRFAPGLYDAYSAIIGQSGYGENIVMEDRWLSDREMVEYISAADFVSVTYQRHFCNASILFRAQKAGRMTLTSDNGWIGRYVRMHDCGLTVDINSAEDYAAGIVHLFAMASCEIPRMGNDEHSEEKFISTIAAGALPGE